MNPPNWREWLYSAKTFFAAMLALYVALELSLPNPYWAVASVYLVSNPLSGATSSRSAYRICGTLLGAVAAVALIQTCPDVPMLLTVVIACWTGSLLYLALLDRTPRSYVFMLAAYTTPIIGIPAFMHPEIVFDIALARSEEILLGIVCATVVNTSLFPTRISPILGSHMRTMLKDAANWAREFLDVRPAHTTLPPMRHRLMADVAAIDVLITHLSFDPGTNVQAEHARQMRLRMAMLIPQLTALFDPLFNLVQKGSDASEDIASLVSSVTQWMHEIDRESAHAHKDLHAKIEQFRSALPHPRSVVELSIYNALYRLDELVDLWRDCWELQNAYAGNDPVRHVTLRYKTHNLLSEARHSDYGLMAFSAISAAVATAIAILCWLNLGWEPGAGGVVSVAIVCCFFAASDEPIPLLNSVLFLAIASSIFSLVYLFAILPDIHTFVGLALVLAPPLLFAAAFTGRLQHTMTVVLFCAQAITNLTLRSSYTADFESFANASLGNLLGVVFALVWTSVTKPFGVEFAARRLTRANWRDLEALAYTSSTKAVSDIAALTLDRASQLLPRLGLIVNQQFAPVDPVRDIRICLSLIELQQIQLRTEAPAATQLVNIVQGVGDYFRQCREEGLPLVPPVSLRQRMDAVIPTLLSRGEKTGRDCALALSNLYLALFPGPQADEDAAKTVPVSDVLQSSVV
ncbi:FUSC family protein [Cupriavidus numazuensis]|uniref:p-hydroxybenzoic acid efflux pump subunit AaeB n=1 Tax=Cupriavidus numazuensis TaxID=221992 RepID=A0ABM8TLU7_9BURK|nr:FUSC family protein [Cupriavidus numazuensis]CAG2154136.1 p-hydroxybenzoic acid efflux pump subunit AaeB [Cupriavidus numazuensis]